VQRENISAAPEAYFKRFYYDTVCRNVPALRMALSMFGIGHIIENASDLINTCARVVG
jgi:hypothetical protein